MPEGGLRLGMTLPQFTDDPGRLLDTVARAEAAGLDSIWLFDHLWPLSGGKERPILEQWTTLAFVAERTTSIGIGTFVTRSSMRHPAVLAKMAATVASIAPGRLTVALGSGDILNADENEAFGLPFWPSEQRADQLASTARVLRRFFAEETVSVDDRFVVLDGLPSSPRPPVAPELWVGGNSVALGRVAREVADAWNLWGLPPDTVARCAAAAAGPSGRSVELTWGAVVQLDTTDAAASAKAAGRERHVVGGPQTVGRHFGRLAEAGVSHVVATFPNASAPGVLEMFADEVRASASMLGT